jgi:hypothetical protein
MSLLKMNPEWKEKWLKALRSGEFKQCKGTLYSNGAFCCLGVLAEIVHREHPDKFEKKIFFSIGNEDLCLYDSKNIDLSELLQEITGLTSVGEIPGGGIRIDEDGSEDGFAPMYTHLAELNDDAEWNFNQIADVIQEKF